MHHRIRVSRQWSNAFSATALRKSGAITAARYGYRPRRRPRPRAARRTTIDERRRHTRCCRRGPLGFIFVFRRWSSVCGAPGRLPEPTCCCSEVGKGLRFFRDFAQKKWRAIRRSLSSLSSSSSSAVPCRAVFEDENEGRARVRFPEPIHQPADCRSEASKRHDHIDN